MSSLRELGSSRHLQPVHGPMRVRNWKSKLSMNRQVARRSKLEMAATTRPDSTLESRATVHGPNSRQDLEVFPLHEPAVGGSDRDRAIQSLWMKPKALDCCGDHSSWSPVAAFPARESCDARSSPEPSASYSGAVVATGFVVRTRPCRVGGVSPYVVACAAERRVCRRRLCRGRNYIARWLL